MRTYFEAFCNENTTLPGTMSSRVTSLCGKLGPSPRAFLKGKKGNFSPEKLVFKTLRDVLFLKLGLITKQLTNLTKPPAMFPHLSWLHVSV